ncbi:unnamed protein product [Microthlaspi erraticum]|uniref:KIB1-4 beta-propeller domain-containing protein n=1 Tax=Microthlaspi erraticum TaxID=1685480 RepID=A0A6D2KEJ6_9BRAS|nr:unnamed protein product [Microthlaspi erraticum]
MWQMTNSSSSTHYHHWLSRSEHLVETPTGDIYFVKWYTQRCLSSGMALTERFYVFRLLKNGAICHIRDIGDKCIFLSSRGEPFCLQASLYGLSRNCIYFVGGDDFGKFNIADNLVVSKEMTTSPAPYIIPPQS